VDSSSGGDTASSGMDVGDIRSFGAPRSQPVAAPSPFAFAGPQTGFNFTLGGSTKAAQPDNEDL